MTRNRPSVFCTGLRGILLLMLFSGCASSPHRPWEGLFTGSEVRFSLRDREIVYDFYRDDDFPPGLEAPGTIAPDLSTRLERSGVLPPGPGEMPLPVRLEEQLSSLPSGHVRFRLGDDIVLMDTRTREVRDVIPEVFR